MDNLTLKSFYEKFKYRDDVKRMLDSISLVLGDSENTSDLFIYPQKFFNCLNEKGAMVEDIKFYFIKDGLFYIAYHEKDNLDMFITEAKPLSEIDKVKVYQNHHYDYKVQLLISFKDKTDIKIDTTKDCDSFTQYKLHKEALLKIVQSIKL